MSEDKKSRLARPKKASPRPMQEAFVDQDTDAPEPVTMFNIRMNADLHRRLKVSAFKQERTMKDILEELLRDYLNERKE